MRMCVSVNGSACVLARFLTLRLFLIYSLSLTLSLKACRSPDEFSLSHLLSLSLSLPPSLPPSSLTPSLPLSLPFSFSLQRGTAAIPESVPLKYGWGGNTTPSATGCWCTRSSPRDCGPMCQHSWPVSHTLSSPLSRKLPSKSCKSHIKTSPAIYISPATLA